MPNRIIKESIRESDSVNKLSPQAEVLFVRLFTYADDYGYFKADPRILNPAIFPLKKYTDKQVTGWLDEIGATGMISFYQANDQKLYGTFTAWEKHQQIRNVKSKYPPPNSYKQEQLISNLLISFEINSNQELSNDSLARARAESESESESNPIMYGEMKNVKLSNKEYNSLCIKFGETLALQKINEFSVALASHKSYSKKYKSHYATILAWHNRDLKQAQTVKSQNTQKKGKPESISSQLEKKGIK